MPIEKIQGKRANGLFIVCEGLDCSGKTTSIRKAIEIMGENAVYSRGICSDTFAGRIASRFPSTFLFLVEQIYLTHFVIKPKLRKGKIVLQDRYFASVASHVPTAERDYNRLLIRMLGRIMLKPDVLLYFTVSEKERIKRLIENPSKHHAELIEKPWLIALRENAYAAYYNAFGGKKETIDTTGLSIKESSKRILLLAKSN